PNRGEGGELTRVEAVAEQPPERRDAAAAGSAERHGPDQARVRGLRKERKGEGGGEEVAAVDHGTQNPRLRTWNPAACRMPSSELAVLSLVRATRPHRALILSLGHRLHPLVEEALQATPVVGLGGVDVPLRVGRDAVDRVELARHLAALAEAREDFERLAIEDPHLLVVAVREVDELLLRIVGEGDVPRRTVAERALAHPGFLDELAFGREH